ncbi:MAG: diguanylate cyclase/phosphodiesterase (GGDEF & EAL domains) with PAS/PAC sensor(s) [uncultured Chloroflexi bacterium]|uniref:Diguanylate cyclase/phosphodiesterase (GGDEF & EAL domains) with PAS/PAC sensor(S) n=1 Tax=uncultured Chloroflexota bacterium TaxID=166587 RepID=A0A6J4IXA3_9CHLR|nr:MAG: diguanylate cyclase/phosphodiesterase (GGDEF & EAL domains) with PAS/PAC sensor(s) [uncultured Chloroflexota bacterium]
MAGKDAVDRLTGLLEGASFREELQRVAQGADLLTLGLLDADNFKELNDTHGHAAGDALLTAVGQRLKALAEQAGGVAGRIGGDEFAVVLPGVSLESGFLQMERFRAGVTAVEGLVPEVPGYRPSISIGVANYPRDVKSAGDLLARADQALWQAKEAGRNQVALPTVEEMVMKTCYYTTAQIGRLKRLAEKRSVTESSLLREALDDLLRKHDVK